MNKPVRVYILMSEKHYDVISNLAGSKGQNDINELAKLKCTDSCPSKLFNISDI